MNIWRLFGLIVTIAAASQAYPQLAEPPNLMYSQVPETSDPAVANFDSNPFLDLITPNVYQGLYSFHSGLGVGVFGTGNTLSPGKGFSIDYGDINLDGHLDIAVSDESGWSVFVGINDGYGGFQGPLSRTIYGIPMANGVKVVDTNNDGHLDIVVGCYYGSSVVTLLGNGTHQIGDTRIETIANDRPAFIAVADFDGDLIKDLAAVNFQTHSPGALSILKGTGSGAFSIGFAGSPLTLGAYPGYPEPVDVDGDDDMDLVVPSAFSPSGASGCLMVFRNDPTGAFSLVQNIPVSASVIQCRSVDLDGDSDMDIVANSYSGTIISLENDGTGTFSVTQNFSIGSGGSGRLASADLDLDGDLDIVAAADWQQFATIFNLQIRESSESTLYASQDTYLRRGSPNQSQGSDGLLRIQSSGHNRSLIAFSQPEIAAAVGNRSLRSAKLMVFIHQNSNNWGSGRAVNIHRLTVPWTEFGATWNCPDDTDTSNSRPDGATWEMHSPPQWPFVSTPTSSLIHSNGLSGWVEFDVTTDVDSFLNGDALNHGWLIKKAEEQSSGAVDFSSREGSQVPRLVLVCH